MEAGQSGAVEIPLAAAILTAIFCCQPFGIVAIVYAAMAQGRLSDGNVEAARDLAGKSWFWIKLALGIGIAWTVIVLLFMVGMSGTAG
ncbi:MAG: CD225/dispanin family protein [Planctomycetota bacterium]